MTHEEIIKAWFAIDELGGENVYTELSSFHFCGKNDKLYLAKITCGEAYNFYAIATDSYKAMERTINEYSAWADNKQTVPIVTPTFVEVETLSETERGDGGYGSTGK